MIAFSPIESWWRWAALAFGATYIPPINLGSGAIGGIDAAAAVNAGMNVAKAAVGGVVTTPRASLSLNDLSIPKMGNMKLHHTARSNPIVAMLPPKIPMTTVVKGRGHIQDITLDNGNSVKIYFSKTKDGINSNLTVNSTLINAFNGTIRAVALKTQITSITISATTNGVHGTSSRHYEGNAVDISMVNGIPVAPKQPIIESLQNAFELQSGRRENFGPSYMLKSGAPYITPALTPALYKKRIEIRNNHQSHIHWSVD